MKNYSNLKKAGFDMRRHKVAKFLLPGTAEEDSDEVVIDEAEEFTLNPT